MRHVKQERGFAYEGRPDDRNTLALVQKTKGVSGFALAAEELGPQFNRLQAKRVLGMDAAHIQIAL
jgi:hypothetical protein